jgi:mono/diheme cytochrome c family protein
MKGPIFGGIALSIVFAAMANAEQIAPLSDAASDDRPTVKESDRKVDRAIDDAAQSTKSAIDSAKEAAINAIEKAKRAVKEALEKAKPRIGSSIEKAKQASSEALEHAKRATEEVLDKARDATDDALGSAKQAADSGHGGERSDNPANAGEATYTAYCSLCHGVGTGPGVFANALKKPAPDLTQIAKRNGGMFPRERVEAVIRDGGITGHGTMHLLAWERYFRQDAPPEHADRVIEDLVSYLEKHQAP